MSTKYLRSTADSMHDRQKRQQNACRGLCISVRECRPQMESGLCTKAGLATAALTIVLFTVWFFAG